MKKKIDWLAVLQGFSMLLVVIGHITLTNVPRDPSTPSATGIETAIYTFHMPLFIFISGWLFFYTCIRKEKSYKDVLVSKLKRLAIPFLAFTLVTTLLKIAFPQLMHRVVDVEEIINTFVLFSSNPLGEMWFLVVLFELMLLYPVYKFVLKSKTATVIALLAGVLLNRIVPSNLLYFQLYRVCYMLPFFIVGMMCCKYEWQKCLSNIGALVLLAILFTVCNVFDLLPPALEIVTVFVGILFSLSLCLMLSKPLPWLFNSFRDYTFQIFLLGIFFQMAIRWIYVRIGNDSLFIPMWFLSVLVGVYVPTIIAKTIKKFAPKYICMCFGI